MKHNKWKYSQTSVIRNYKDLDREIERAELYQKFLGEVLQNDKKLIKRAFSLPNIMQNVFAHFRGNSGGNDDSAGGNTFFTSIAKWIIGKLF